MLVCFFFSSRRRHTRCSRDWSSDVCSSDLSELVGLKLSDVTFRAGYVDIHVMGKGRKERVLTLWKTVAGSLRAWLSIRGDASVPELFLNARAQPLTRSGFKHILNKHIPAAVSKCPPLKTKRLSPHVLRSEEHTSELQSRLHLVCRLLLEKKTH